MSVLYWIAAIVLSIIAASITSLVVMFLMDTLRDGILDPSVNRFWDWCVNGIITLTYLAIPFYTHADDSLSTKISSWGSLWSALYQLLSVEARWFIYIVIFWFCIIAVIHMSLNSSE